METSWTDVFVGNYTAEGLSISNNYVLTPLVYLDSVFKNTKKNNARLFKKWYKIYEE